MISRVKYYIFWVLCWRSKRCHQLCNLWIDYIGHGNIIKPFFWDDIVRISLAYTSVSKPLYKQLHFHAFFLRNNILSKYKILGKYILDRVFILSAIYWNIKKVVLRKPLDRHFGFWIMGILFIEKLVGKLWIYYVSYVYLMRSSIFGRAEKRYWILFNFGRSFLNQNVQIRKVKCQDIIGWFSGYCKVTLFQLCSWHCGAILEAISGW